MASVALYIQDGIQRITLKTMLESDGHAVRAEAGVTDAEIVFADLGHLEQIVLDQQPVIVLTPIANIPNAVDAMRNGAWGYIVTPFQPKEASMIVHRALRSGSSDAVESLENLPTMETVEFEHIRRALRLCNGNQARAARVLNIGRNTLWRKLKKMEQESRNG